MLLQNLFPTGQYGDGGRAFVVGQGGGYSVAYATLSGTTWALTTAGIAALAAEPVLTGYDAAGAINGATVTATEYGVGEKVHTTLLTLAALPQAIVNTTHSPLDVSCCSVQ
mgnify:CR=1 FL=1